MPQFAPAPPGPEGPFGDADDEPMAAELTEEYPEEDDDAEEIVPVVVWDADRDWYLDHTETQWLTTKEIEDRFPAYRSSTFAETVARNVFGLGTARRRVWRQYQPRRSRHYQVYEYPLWRVEAWVCRHPELTGPDADARDRAESQWVTAADVEQQFNLDRTTFQHAVSRNEHHLHATRRAAVRAQTPSRREQVYQYPLWRVELWAGAPGSRTLPTLEEVKQLRSELDSAASLLAREVGFSTSEVRAAAAVGDLDAKIDPNTNKVLFLPPQATRRWLQRDGWRQTG